MMDLPPLKILLVITNFSMLSFLIVLIVDHYKSNNNVFSWSSYFHFLCLLWLCIRGAFWLRTVTSVSAWGEFSFYSLYWLPNPIQFGSFMLLPLFFTQVLYPEEWKKYWIYARPIYYLVLLCLVIFQILWAMLAAFEKKSLPENCIDNTTSGCGQFHTEYSSAVFRVVTSLSFLLLSVCQGVYAMKIINLEKTYYQRYFILNQNIMAVVHGILVFSFFSKGLYQLLALFGHYLLSDIPLQGDSDIDFMVFLSFEIWEYIPTILLVLTVTSKTLSGGNIEHSNSVHLPKKHNMNKLKLNKTSKSLTGNYRLIDNSNNSNNSNEQNLWPLISSSIVRDDSNNRKGESPQSSSYDAGGNTSSKFYYGSFTTLNNMSPHHHQQPQDDIVSVCSDALESFSSSFEKSVRSLSFSQEGWDGGKPLTLHSKSSWLPGPGSVVGGTRGGYTTRLGLSASPAGIGIFPQVIPDQNSISPYNSSQQSYHHNLAFSARQQTHPQQNKTQTGSGFDDYTINTRDKLKTSPRN